MQQVVLHTANTQPLYAHYDNMRNILNINQPHRTLLTACIVP